MAYVTYEGLFTFIMMFCSVITLIIIILKFKGKKK